MVITQHDVREIQLAKGAIHAAVEILLELTNTDPDDPDTFTDPDDPDTDGDGVPDGEEYYLLSNHLVTNPLDADTDDDGIVVGVEFALVVDPLDADTDGDGTLELDPKQRALNPVQPVYWKVKEWD